MSNKLSVRRRSRYAVPTFITVLNLFFGFVAIMFSMRAVEATALGDLVFAADLFKQACRALALAAVFDTFDGLVARKMNATSEFGREYDSIADVVTFGAAPAVLIYAWGLHNLGRVGGVVAFLFLAGGSLRLARFNVQAETADHRFFIGLPIPAAALTLAAIIYYAPVPVTDRSFATVIAFVTAGLAVAMVSTVRYRSQKYANLQSIRSVFGLLVTAAIVAIMWYWTEEFFFVLFVTYVTSGPLLFLWRIALGRSDEARREPVEVTTPEAEGA